MSGSFHMRARLPRSIRHTETLVSTHVCAGVKPPPDGYGEGQGGLPYPISEGGDTPPRPATGNTSGSGPGELQYLIRGGGVDSGMFPAPPQGGWTHLSPRRTLQKLVEGGVPQEKIEDPPHIERWMCLADILHHMWRRGDIPQDIGCTFLVLIPKGTTNTQGI